MDYTYTAKEIKEELNISQTYLNRLKKRGLSYKVIDSRHHLYNMEEAKRISNPQKREKYVFDECFFEKIDTEGKAYWLGFIYADGNVYNGECFSVGLSITDENHLKKLKDIMKSNHPLVYGYNNTNKPYVRMQLSRVKLVKQLENLGVVSRKSLILQFPTNDQVPTRLIRHFIRGYFDGDGSIFKCKKRKDDLNKWGCNFVGSYSFIRSLETLMNLEIGNFSIEPSGNVCKLKVYNKLAIREFYNFLYSDSYIFLERKYYKFIQFLNEVDFEKIESLSYCQPKKSPSL